METIAYKSGYKYQLNRAYTVKTGVRPIRPALFGPLTLSTDGVLTIREGYAWDGPSGPTIDTNTFMRGSLVHDALYQLMRLEMLGREHRLTVDKLLRTICIEDGMWRVRAWWVYQGVRFGGKSATDPANRKKVIHAP